MLDQYRGEMLVVELVCYKSKLKDLPARHLVLARPIKTKISQLRKNLFNIVVPKFPWLFFERARTGARAEFKLAQAVVTKFDSLRRIPPEHRTKLNQIDLRTLERYVRVR